MGTDNGIVIYDYVLDDFRRPSGYELLDDRVYDIAQDSEGALWIGSRSQGLFRYDPAADRISRVPVKKDDAAELTNIYRICIDSNDKMYLVSYCDNIYCMEIGSDRELSRLDVHRQGFFEGDDVEGLCVGPRADYLGYVASKRHGLCEVNTMTGTIRILYHFSSDSRPQTNALKYFTIYRKTSDKNFGRNEARSSRSPPARARGAQRSFY